MAKNNHKLRSLGFSTSNRLILCKKNYNFFKNTFYMKPIFNTDMISFQVACLVTNNRLVSCRCKRNSNLMQKKGRSNVSYLYIYLCIILEDVPEIEIKTKKKNQRKWKRWTQQESKIVLDAFHGNLISKILPGKEECLDLIEKTGLTRSWGNVKDFIRNQSHKYPPTSS